MEPSAVHISIVIPVYKAEEIVDELVKRLVEAVSPVTQSFEVILVEDGSPDKSWEKIETHAETNPHVIGIKLSRNFGQHVAITAGLEKSKGDFVVVMDCDLQDNPDYIPELYKKANEGFDIVYTRKQNRSHSFFKNLFSKIFFALYNILSDTQPASAQTGSYSMLSRKVVDAFCRIKDSKRHYLMVLRILGFSHTYLDIVHDERFAGETSYTFGKMLSHAIDGITSQSSKLLRISVGIGFSLFLLSIISIIALIIKYFTIGAEIGWTSTLVVMVFSTGLIMMAIGVVGIYIGNIFDQVRGRPLYFVENVLPNSDSVPPNSDSVPPNSDSVPPNSVSEEDPVPPNSVSEEDTQTESFRNGVRKYKEDPKPESLRNGVRRYNKKHNKTSYGINQTSEVNSLINVSVEAIRQKGYTVLENLISVEDAYQLSQHLENIYQKQKSEFSAERLSDIGEADVVRCPLAFEETFLEMATNPVIREIIQELLGNYYILHLQNGIINRPGKIHHQTAWHRDLPYQNFVSSTPLAISVLWCLDDFTLENGGTILIPGSHKMESLPSDTFLEKEHFTLEAPAGSVLIFDSMVFHRAGENDSDVIRRGVNNVYSIPLIKQQINIPSMLGPRFEAQSDMGKLFGYDSQVMGSVEEFRRRREKRITNYE